MRNSRGEELSVKISGIADLTPWSDTAVSLSLKSSLQNDNVAIGCTDRYRRIRDL